jgi:2-polyprenyl-6-methoxyphenol hydroxylase-like FAD-dependent oxidoreductase
METAFDAIVIGAGPAGSSAAIVLARAGWRVAIIEKQAFPRRKVCGECISASNLPFLASLGIGKRLSGMAGPPLRQVALVCGDRMVCAPLPAYPDPAHRWGVALGREHLDTLLLGQATHHGAEIFQPWLMCHADGSPGKFRCRIRAMETREERCLSAPLLIDAHGSWEALQAFAATPRTPHHSSDLLAFKANFSGTRIGQGMLPVLSFAGGYGGMVIGEQAVATFAFCLRRDALIQARLRFPGLGAPEAAASWIMQHCPAAAALIAGAAQSGKWIAAGPIRPGIRIGQVRSAAFLVGNAAGEAHPIIGEGISVAIQSAMLAASMLAPYRHDIHDARLQSRLQAAYARVWRQHFARRMRLSALFAHAAMRPRTVEAALPILKRYPMLLSQLARWSGKVQAGPTMESGRQAIEYQ